MLGEARYVGFIPVRDTSEARRFYEGTLGLQVLEDTPFALVVEAKATMLRVTPVPELAVQPFTIAGWHVADVAMTARALADRGVVCTFYDGMVQDELGIWTSPGGDRVAWFRDPDGDTLSLTPSATP
jgi:catechol 2,3-dioxygenase-like lactoylglutathione lyase family enzyme